MLPIWKNTSQHYPGEAEGWSVSAQKGNNLKHYGKEQMQLLKHFLKYLKE